MAELALERVREGGGRGREEEEKKRRGRGGEGGSRGWACRFDAGRRPPSGRAAA